MDKDRLFWIGVRRAIRMLIPALQEFGRVIAVRYGLDDSR